MAARAGAGRNVEACGLGEGGFAGEAIAESSELGWSVLVISKGVCAVIVYEVIVEV